MNPTSAWEAIEVFLGYIILKLSPTEDIQFRTLKPLRIIIYNYDHDLNAWNFSIPLGLLPGRVYPPPIKTGRLRYESQRSHCCVSNSSQAQFPHPRRWTWPQKIKLYYTHCCLSIPPFSRTVCQQESTSWITTIIDQIEPVATNDK